MNAGGDNGEESLVECRLRRDALGPIRHEPFEPHEERDRRPSSRPMKRSITGALEIIRSFRGSEVEVRIGSVADEPDKLLR
jgi:hypothetical protein